MTLQNQEVLDEAETEAVKLKMSKARAFLLLDHPFFATLLLYMTPVNVAGKPGYEIIDTMATDGRYLYYNPSFVQKLDLQELIGILAHEAMHPAMAHHLRRGGREPRKWNVAADYAINPIVLDSGLKLPKDALVDAKYKDLMAEEIYNLLPVSKSGGKGTDQDPGKCGGVMDATDGKGKPLSKAEIDQLTAEAKSNLAQAAALAKARGKLPAGIEALVDEMLNPQVPWTDVLRMYVAKLVKTDTTWTNPSRRFAHTGLTLPGTLKEGTGEIVIGVDTSGSIYCDKPALAQFLGEIDSILEDVKPERVHLVYCDAAVNGVDTFEFGDAISPKTFKPKGGGGTAFEPVFDWARDNAAPMAIVYLTDLMGSFPTGCDVPTIWVCANNEGGTAPFGEVIHVKTGEKK